jgi:hypothetical protein
MKRQTETLNITPRITPVGDRSKPVVFWAIVGSAFLLLAAYIWGSWLISPIFRPAPVGPDPLPDSVRLTVRICEAAGGLTGLFILVKFVLLPLWRERRLSFDGMLVLNFLLMWWMDPMVNYYNYSFSYNSHTFNMGSWAKFIPGWSYPNAENFPEPLVMMGGFYTGYWMITALLGCWLIRKIREWQPGTSVAMCLTALFVAMFAIDLAIEMLILRTGLAAYPGVVSEISIFPGKVYQWPLYEGLGVGLSCVGFTALRYFKDDKGHTFVERGLDRLRLSSGGRSVLRFCAVAGFIQPMFLLGFYFTYNAFLFNIDSFPSYPSYMRNMMCGEGTDYACPNRRWVPIPSAGATLHVRPDDPRLPPEVRNQQGISALGQDPYTR